MKHRLGIDFGTSNTAAAIMAGDKPYLIPVEEGKTTLPTSVFFDTHRANAVYGSAANAALIDGREGRFMRALKSVLGTPLMHERRLISYQRVTLIEVVALFLTTVKQRAEQATGLTIDSVLSGRPVRFHPDPDRNARAEVDLRSAYETAGFTDISFMYEPEAAAQTSTANLDGNYGLVVDIGGGTSDFTIFEKSSGQTRVIASHGVRVGGTNFDRALNLATVMPLLGYHGELKNEMCPGTHTAPNALFQDLATWEKIPFLYTPETQRFTKRYAKLALDKPPFERLAEVIEMEMGHDISFAVEAGKIARNASDSAEIDLSFIEPNLVVPLSGSILSTTLTPLTTQISDAARATLAMADLSSDDIGTVVYVGGSSLMRSVTEAITAVLPNAAQERTAAFTAVADGLAMAAAQSR
ncbi:hypothetical chaperone protein [Cognatiyoonia sediminum]|uniref:Hypothetical chaperone protein n=1 Tax=Cognatiyoonia sediminum TaxID=1508389 RepID=A0A1M5Q478_9RHOB|nr:Hsp70 family protein [Cognatiyoonia sediminum]SHH08706.1 hypothetical chaperone protein [Cognatiyoonia sediminum]